MTRAELVLRTTREVVTVRLTLHDAEPRRFQNSTVRGRMYQPLRARLVYERCDGRGWDVEATLLGRSVIRDGALGMLETDEKFYSRGSLPDWLDALVLEYMPAVTG